MWARVQNNVHGPEDVRGRITQPVPARTEQIRTDPHRMVLYLHPDNKEPLDDRESLDLRQSLQ